jgi:kinase-associated protein B
MPEASYNIGDVVHAEYKTGEYAGEVVELRPPFAIVKILAVLKHPTQGDLHNPMEVAVPLFHQRRALSYQEKARVPLSQMAPYKWNIPDYSESLRSALGQQIEELEKTLEWAKRSLDELVSLKSEYKLD